MVQLKQSFLAAAVVVPMVALALPTPVDEALVSPRNAEFKTYSGVFLNRYEETAENGKRDAKAEAEAEAEAETEGKATYGGVFLNRYEETPDKEKRDAKAEAAGKATYGGVFLNRYEESPQKE